MSLATCLQFAEKNTGNWRVSTVVYHRHQKHFKSLHKPLASLLQADYRCTQKYEYTSTSLATPQHLQYTHPILPRLEKFLFPPIKCVFGILIIICRLTSCCGQKFFTIWTTFLFLFFPFLFFRPYEKQRTAADIKHLRLSQSEHFFVTFYLFICVWLRANWHLRLKIPCASLSRSSAAFEAGECSRLSLFPASC